jgi:cell wall-associated NlpC family hydrolase
MRAAPRALIIPSVTRTRTLLAVAMGLLAAAAVAAALALAGGGGARPQPAARPAASSTGFPRGHPQAVEPDVGAPAVSDAEEPGDAAPGPGAGVPRDPEARLASAPAGAAVSPGAPTDAEVRAELRQLQGGGGGRAQVLPNGDAVAPAGAPLLVRELIAAGNAIARTPYVWGGGHARLYDSGYDCSGSLSFAFIHAGLLDHPTASGGSTLGAPGPGRWLSVYSSAGHVFMVVAGLRFDTSAIHIAGSRWTAQPRSTAGFTVRHLPGL